MEERLNKMPAQSQALQQQQNDLKRKLQQNVCSIHLQATVNIIDLTNSPDAKIANYFL